MQKTATVTGDQTRATADGAAATGSMENDSMEDRSLSYRDRRTSFQNSAPATVAAAQGTTIMIASMRSRS